jgi:hypothetical protein
LKIKVHLSASDLELWLLLCQDELKEAALADPLVSSVYSTEKNKVAFIVAYLEQHQIVVDTTDDNKTRAFLVAAADSLVPRNLCIDVNGQEN